MHRLRRLFFPTAAAPLIGLALATGCAQTGNGPAARLSPTDFARPDDQHGAGHAHGPSKPLPPVRRITQDEAREGVFDVTSSVGAPDFAPLTTANGGDELPESSAVVAEAVPPVVLDSLVGQINGKPVFAAEFLEPLDGRLRAIAQEQTQIAGWRRAATSEIHRSLREKILDELLLAEAYASLTPEVREQGVRFFLNKLREDAVRNNEGSAALAEQRLRESEGMTLDQKVRDQMKQFLVREEMRRSIVSKIHVSSRDQWLYYERNYDRFHPPATAAIRMLWVRRDNEEAVAAVRAELEGGTPFAEVARSPRNSFRADEGGLLERTFSGEYSEATLLDVPELNAIAQRLSPGEVSEPTEFGPFLAWVSLDELRQPPGRSFYDAQLDIAEAIRMERLREAEARYYARLVQKSSITDIEEMMTRLLEVATERHWVPAELARAGGGR